MKHTESHKIKCNFVEINEISEKKKENRKHMEIQIQYPMFKILNKQQIFIGKQI